MGKGCVHIKSFARVIWTITFMFITGMGFAQISPGDLTNAHAQFEGIAACEPRTVTAARRERRRANIINASQSRWRAANVP